MLEFIREKAQGWVAWTIVGMLIIPFALWGINSYFQEGGDAVVANVNGTDISLREYQDLLQQQRDRVRSMLGAQANADLIETLVKPRDVLEGSIDRELLMQYANKAGYRVSDTLLAEQIRNIEGFQRDGQFSKQQYETYLRSQGMTAAGFESRFARSALLDQVNSGVMDTALITNKDVEAHIRLRDEKREFGYLVIPLSTFEATVDATPEKISEYYERQRDKFVQPEEVSVEYVELRASDMLSKVTATEAEIKQYYDDQKEQFGIGEERRARHILIASDKTKDPSGEKAQTRANELHERIKKGESFEELAKKNSEDPGSAKSGGDLGYFGRGQMDKEFEAAAYALKKGEFSAPVKSSFGYHIIKVEDIRAPTQKPYSEVRAEIENLVKQKKAETMFFDQSEVLASTAYEKPDSLLPVADALGLKIQTSPLFGKRGGPGVAANPKVAAAAFKDEVLNKGLNSEPIEAGPNYLVVLRVKDHKAEAPRSLDEVKAQVSIAVKRELAGRKAEETAKAAMKRIEAGEDPAAVSKELKLEWKPAVFAGRNEATLDRSLVEHVFKLVRPAAGKTTSSSFKLPNGDYAVARMTSVKEGDPKQIDETQKKEIAKNLADTVADQEFTALLEHAKKNAKISRFEDKL